MDVFSNLGIGFAAALTLQNILFCLMGCLLGTLIGVLPGIGPIATIAMLLPITYGLDPLSALIMLAGTLPTQSSRQNCHIIWMTS